jgi:hypothetical protein
MAVKKITMLQVTFTIGLQQIQGQKLPVPINDLIFDLAFPVADAPVTNVVLNV